MSELKLRDQLKAQRQGLQKTGNLFGLEQPEAQGGGPRAPTRRSGTSSRTCATSAWETGCKVSSSPIAVEGGDALWALHLPTGEAICVSRGITAHPGLLADDDPELHRDSATRTSRASSRATSSRTTIPTTAASTRRTSIRPCRIFYDDKLIAWASCVTHVSDCGSVTPGSIGFINPDCYSDGVLRLDGEGGRRTTPSTRGTSKRIRSRTRTPDCVLGDARGSPGRLHHRPREADRGHRQVRPRLLPGRRRRSTSRTAGATPWAASRPRPCRAACASRSSRTWR